jgi:hypothetical protein
MKSASFSKKAQYYQRAPAVERREHEAKLQLVKE